MRSIDDLREELNAQTARLTVSIAPEHIRQRARGIRTRRMATTAVVAASAVIAIAIPAVLLAGEDGRSTDIGATPSPRPSACVSASPGDDISIDVNPMVDTGAILDAPNRNARFDVVLGVAAPCGRAVFTVGFRDRNAGVVGMTYNTQVGRDDYVNFTDPDVGTFQFLTAQLTLGPHQVLDVGLYSRTATRVTIASEATETEAHTLISSETGWTFFWAQRAAAPLPSGRNQTAEGYSGPEQITVTAYDSVGQLLDMHSGGSFIGFPVHNPRDNWPTDGPS